MNNVVNVYGKITSPSDAGIAINGTSTVNIYDGAEITAHTGIAIKRGTLNMNGGTVTANGAKNIPPVSNTNGTEPTGAGISITDTYLYAGSITVNLNGGSVTSANAPGLYQLSPNHSDKVTINVTGTSITGAE